MPLESLTNGFGRDPGGKRKEEKSDVDRYYPIRRMAGICLIYTDYSVRTRL